MPSPGRKSDYDELTRRFIQRHGDDCSHVFMRWWQAAWYLLVIFILVLGLFYRWDITLAVTTAALAFCYFAIILFKFGVAVLSLLGFGWVKIGSDELAALQDDQLPVYTVLVPLYREANIAGKIIRSLDRLDYPKTRLDVKLILESDDLDTIDAVSRIDLPDNYDVIVIPDSIPKTKPKACNHGLARAKGEFCVIYDAEDRPDPDQLKKAVCAFRRLPDKIGCLQARLNYYNTHQNLLTKWFSIEYMTTFDLVMPGLQCAKVPIPLGGTSNHFRIAVLKGLEGWDPFNVTEDCDLGVRLYRAGYSTRMLESTTLEEATSSLWNWIRQRSRWVKGFFQTHITHIRNPVQTVRDLGPWGYCGFVLSVGGSSLMMVLNICYWFIGGAYILLAAGAVAHGRSIFEILKGPREAFVGNIVWPMIYYGPGQDSVWSTLSIVFFIISCILILANLLFIVMHCLACTRRKAYDLLPFAVLMPFYWVLISIGAWKGFIQLFARPFYWEKTIHGRGHVDPDRRIEPPRIPGGNMPAPPPGMRQWNIE